MTRSTKQRTFIRAAVDVILNQCPANALNRLVHPTGVVWRDLIGMSDANLKRRTLAGWEEIKRGRTSLSDPRMKALLILRSIRWLSRHVAASDAAAIEKQARARATAVKGKLANRLKARPPALAAREAAQALVHPMVVFQLAEIINRLWQEGEIELWCRVPGQAAAASVEPIGRRLNFVSGAKLGEWVIDWTTIDPGDLWRDDRKDLWRYPHLTRQGFNSLRAVITSMLRPTAAELDAWMAANAAASEKLIREPTINACCRETGATNREAQDAWDRLPPEVKFGRGQRASRWTKSDR